MRASALYFIYSQEGYILITYTKYDVVIYRLITLMLGAGESGVDPAVLPENAFGRPGMDVSACYHAPEPVDGESVKTVQVRRQEK